MWVASVPEGCEAHPLRARHQLAHDLRPADFALVVGARVCAVRHGVLDGGKDLRPAVAKQQSAMTAGKIDILVAVPVPLARPLGPA